MDDHPVHIIPNHHPSKMDVLLKTFLQVILAANWLVTQTSNYDICLPLCIYPSCIVQGYRERELSSKLTSFTLSGLQPGETYGIQLKTKVTTSVT